MKPSGPQKTQPPAQPIYPVVRGIARDAAGKILLLRRSAGSKAHPLCWEFPGGKMDAGETVDQALVREFKEETGLDIRPGRLIGSSHWDYGEYRMVYLIFEVLIGGSTPSVQISGEHQQFAWVSPDELRGLLLSPQLEKFKDLPG